MSAKHKASQAYVEDAPEDEVPGDEVRRVWSRSPPIDKKQSEESLSIRSYKTSEDSDGVVPGRRYKVITPPRVYVARRRRDEIREYGTERLPGSGSPRSYSSQPPTAPGRDTELDDLDERLGRLRERVTQIENERLSRSAPISPRPWDAPDSWGPQTPYDPLPATFPPPETTNAIPYGFPPYGAPPYSNPPYGGYGGYGVPSYTVPPPAGSAGPYQVPPLAPTSGYYPMPTMPYFNRYGSSSPPPPPPPYPSRSVNNPFSAGESQYVPPRNVVRRPGSLAPDAENLNSELDSEHDIFVDQDGLEMTFRKVEKEGLSVTLQVKKDGDTLDGGLGQQFDAKPAPVEASAWRQPKTVLNESESTCELFNIHALEYAMNANNEGKTTLICPAGPKKDSSDALPVQLRWLHVQRTGLDLKVLQRIVLDCPYIRKDLAAVTVTLLDDVELRFGKVSESGSYMEQGAILRYIGKYTGHLDATEPKETEPVLFASTPHLTLQKPTSLNNGYCARTLLQSLYGYELEDASKTQIVRKMSNGKPKELIHVNQMWFLLIGSNILITMSDKSAQQMQGNTVTIDVRKSNDGGLLVVRFFDQQGRQYNSAIDTDYTYVDLLRHAVTLVMGTTDEALEFELLDAEDDELTPSKWLRILSTSPSQLLELYLRDKRADGNPYDLPTHEIYMGSRRSQSFAPSTRTGPSSYYQSQTRPTSPQGNILVAPYTYQSYFEPLAPSNIAIPPRGRQYDRPAVQRSNFYGNSRSVSPYRANRQGRPTATTRARRKSSSSPEIAPWINRREKSRFPPPLPVAGTQEPELTIRRRASMYSPRRGRSRTPTKIDSSRLKKEAESSEEHHSEILNENSVAIVPFSEERWIAALSTAVDTQETTPRGASGETQGSGGGNDEELRRKGPKGRQGTFSSDWEDTSQPIDTVNEWTMNSDTEQIPPPLNSHKKQQDKQPRQLWSGTGSEWGATWSTKQNAPTVAGDETRQDHQADAASEKDSLPPHQSKNDPQIINIVNPDRGSTRRGRATRHRQDSWTSNRVNRQETSPRDRERYYHSIAASNYHDYGFDRAQRRYQSSTGPRYAPSSVGPLVRSAFSRNPYAELPTRARSEYPPRASYNYNRGTGQGLPWAKDVVSRAYVTNDPTMQTQVSPDIFELEQQSDTDGQTTDPNADTSEDGDAISVSSAESHRLNRRRRKVASSRTSDLSLETSVERVKRDFAPPTGNGNVSRFPRSRSASIEIYPRRRTSRGSERTIDTELSANRDSRRRSGSSEHLSRFQKGKLTESPRFRDADSVHTITRSRSRSRGRRGHHRRGSTDNSEHDPIIDSSAPRNVRNVRFRSPTPESRLSFRSRKRSVAHDTRRAEDSLTEIKLVPFLTWRLKNERTLKESGEVEKTLMKILSSVNKTLLRSEIGRLYSHTYKCTRQDLLQRHPVLDASENEQGPKQMEHEGAVPLDSGTGTTSLDSKIPSSQPSTNIGHPVDSEQGERATSLSDTGDSHVEQREQTGIQTGAVPVPPRPSWIARYKTTLMRKFLGVSEDIIWAFIPKTGSPLSHHVSVRFWGAVDAICRQVTWHVANTALSPQKRFVVRDFDRPGKSPAVSITKSPKPRSWAGCSDCKSNKAYDTAVKALNHVHSHRDCSVKSKHPHDDPCYVWVHAAHDGMDRQSVSQSGVLGMIDEFVDTLTPLTSQINELHAIVSSAWNDQARDKKTDRPLLPANLVEAFGEIMMMYIVQAQALSLTNRRGALVEERRVVSQSDDIKYKLERLRALGLKAQSKASSLLHDAKKDIFLLGSTSRAVNSLGVESVGAEFLVMTLIANAQNQNANQDSILVAPASDPDYIEMYRSYATRLRFQASRRPQKRLFLDINALQEELAAVATTTCAQLKLTENLLRLLSPKSLRITNKTRIGQFQAERLLARQQQRKLRALSKNMDNLADRTVHLKERVRQTIEIVEEDHGKAIRVFTIVTLFFLPMSFVTSFMGMNTADIRDMEYGQAIFWSTSVPITAFVVIAAILYGYKGEDIADWLSEKLRPTRRRFDMSTRVPSGNGNKGATAVTRQGTMDSLGF